MPPRAAQYPEQQAHSRIPMSVPDWRQPQGLRGMPGFKPTCRAEFTTWTASGRAGLGAGGRRQDQGWIRDDAPSERSATKRRRYGGCRGACKAGLGAGGRRQGQGGLSGRSKLRPVGGCRVACGTWPRCRWAAAGPGRASRSITPSRRLACGDLAGGPPPTGTHSGQTQQDRPRGGRARRRPENPWRHKPRPKVRTPRSTPGSGRPGGRRGGQAR